MQDAASKPCSLLLLDSAAIGPDAWHVVTHSSRTDRVFFDEVVAREYLRDNDKAGEWHIEQMYSRELFLSAGIPVQPVTLAWEPDYPEEVAYGTPEQSTRLKKWLDAYFAIVVERRNAEKAKADRRSTSACGTDRTTAGGSGSTATTCAASTQAAAIPPTAALRREPCTGASSASAGRSSFSRGRLGLAASDSEPSD